MVHNTIYNTPRRSALKTWGHYLVLVLLTHLVLVIHIGYAQTSPQKLSITYDNRLVTISATNADLKAALLKLADITNTYIKFPASLKKKITIHKEEISLKEALRSLLRGLNHAIIYSVTGKNNVVISRVRVFSEVNKSRLSEMAEARLTRQIKSYERQLASLKNNLSKVDSNSRRGKTYVTRIERLEKRIQSLERQLY
jgi:hypothetical protein